MTKQEVKQMTEQLQESSQKRIWVDEFDKEDWRQLLSVNYWEDYEDGKDFLRVN
jgi:hypothetical protein